jgi:hypothetical protein
MSGVLSVSELEIANAGKGVFSAFGDVADLEFESGIIPMPMSIPERFQDKSWMEPEFDPAIHLAIERPKKMTLLDFSEVDKTPEVEGNDKSCLAYTQAFRLLSDEGVRVLREILARNMDLVRSSERIPSYIRGLAHTSKFIRDLNECPLVLDVLSECAGYRVIPHYLPMNYAHTNFGMLPKSHDVKSVPVDQWHVDSVPFVLIIILSDMTDMIGGELQCIKRVGREAGFKLIEETKNEVSDSEMLTVSYQKQGYCLFMQGSEIVHHVTAVKKAVEPRITMVNSYMPANCFADDRTVYKTFLELGKEKESILEFARGRAWRAKTQLEAFATRAPYSDDPRPYVAFLTRVLSELSMTVDLLAAKADQDFDYFHEVAGDKYNETKSAESTKAGVDASRRSEEEITSLMKSEKPVLIKS